MEGIIKLFKVDFDLVCVVVIIFEFVQGEGGFYFVLIDLVVGLCKFCDDYGIVLIVDEI